MRTNSTFAFGTLAVSPSSARTLAPPKTFTTKRRGSAPSFSISPISRSIAWTPKRVASSGSRPSPPSGRRKWFMPPIRVRGSHMQTATHEPSSVFSTVGSADAWTPPTCNVISFS